MSKRLYVDDIVEINRRFTGIQKSNVRDMKLLKSAVNQPYQTFDGVDLYPSILDKASALCFSVISNHPFLDGNKRTAYCAMEVLLLYHKYTFTRTLGEFEKNCKKFIDRKEKAIMDIATGDMSRVEFYEWIKENFYEYGGLTIYHPWYGEVDDLEYYINRTILENVELYERLA